MTAPTRITLLLLVFGLVVFTVTAQFVTVREPSVRQAAYTANAGELTGDVIVGQTFVAEGPNLSGIAIMFATYTGREISAPITFHLRDSIAATEDIRTAEVAPTELGDNQFHQFIFKPIPDSGDRTFFFFVEAPAAATNEAVTVDVSTQDPYHRGSAYIMRGRGETYDADRLARSGKPTIDLAFTTFHTVPLNKAILTRSREIVRDTITTWDEREHAYRLWGISLVPALLFIGFLWCVRNLTDTPEHPLSRRLKWFVLLILAALGFWLRYRYAQTLPLTFDEGNYLYDAKILQEGQLAGGDGYVKAPLFIGWIALWQWLMGDTVMAGRLASIVASVLTLFPIYSLGRELKNRQTGLMAAAAWALMGSTIIGSIYVHTQPVALFFGVSGLAVLWAALRGTTPKLTFFAAKTIPAVTPWFILAGILLGLGVASRKSILALGLVPMILILAEGKNWRFRLRHLITVGIGFLLIISLFLGGAYKIYGSEGVLEAIGINSAEDGLIAPEDPEQIRAYSLRGMTPFFRESMPLILLSLLGWGFCLEAMVRHVIQFFLRRRLSKPAMFALDYVVPKLGWLAPLAVFHWAYTFFFEYEGNAFHIFGMVQAWQAMAALLIVAALIPREETQAYAIDDDADIKPSLQPGAKLPPNVISGSDYARATAYRGLPLSTTPLWWSLSASLFFPAWVGGLMVFYMNWIKFHANYIAEFLPPLAIYGGAGALFFIWRLQQSVLWNSSNLFLLWLRGVLKVVTVFVLLWTMFISNYITYVHEHTGTFTQQAAQEAAAWARENIPPNERIFTGAALIPYLSGHHVALDIAHPRWYAYEFTRKNPKRLNTFLPSIEEMLTAYRQTEWLLLESQTGFSFLMEYSEIEGGIERNFEPVHAIENGGNTITFYRRIRPESGE
ncbi:MAG: glycosyltransferase family 39 protein [Candidatus Andersenbacteria bacterium]